MKNCFRWISLSSFLSVFETLSLDSYEIVMRKMENFQNTKNSQRFFVRLKCTCDVYMNPPVISRSSAMWRRNEKRAGWVEISRVCISALAAAMKYKSVEILDSYQQSSREKFNLDLEKLKREGNRTRRETAKKVIANRWTRTCSQKHVHPYGFFPFT